MKTRGEGIWFRLVHLTRIRICVLLGFPDSRTRSDSGLNFVLALRTSFTLKER